MPTLNFELRPARNNSAKIYLTYQYGTGMESRLRYSTGLGISHFKNWNSKNQRIKNVIEEIEKTHTNNQLNKIQSFLSDFYTDSLNKGFTITSEILQNELNILLQKKSKIKKIKKENRFLNMVFFYARF